MKLIKKKKNINNSNNNNKHLEDPGASLFVLPDDDLHGLKSMDGACCHHNKNKNNDGNNGTDESDNKNNKEPLEKW